MTEHIRHLEIFAEGGYIDLLHQNLTAQQRFDILVAAGFLHRQEVPDVNEVLQRRKAMIKNGYRLIPMVTKSKRTLHKDWQNGVAENVLLNPKPNSLNTGILCSNVIAIDCDIDDIEFAKKACTIIREFLDARPGKFIVRGRKSSARKAFIVALEGKYGKTSITGPHSPLLPGKVQMIEILAGEKVVHVDGPHEIGEILDYEDGEAPWTVAHADLVVLQPDAVNILLDTLSASLGWTKNGLDRSSLFEISNENSPTKSSDPIVNHELGAGLENTNWFSGLSLQDQSDLIAACLGKIDNTKDDPRDQWLKIIFSLADASSQGCDDAYHLGLEWSKKGAGWTTEEHYKIAWESFKPGRLTIGTLLGLAKDKGLDLTPWRVLASSACNENRTENNTVLLADAMPLGIADIPLVPKKRQWLHGTDLVRGAVSLLVSPGGKGKSSWLIALALACASNQKLLGSPIYGNGLRVLYINTEDSCDEISLRIRAAMMHHNLDDTHLSGLAVIGVDRLRLTLLKMDRNTPTLDPAGFSKFCNLLDSCTPDIVILDPLVALMGGVTLNDNAAAALLMGAMVQIAAKRKLAIMIAHHSSKGRDLSSADAAMGAASLVNLARISLAIEPLNINDAPKIGISPLEYKSFFRITGAKQNLSPVNSDDRIFKLTSVEVPNAEPPLYPNGDHVGVVEKFVQNPSTPPFSNAIIHSALSMVNNSPVPFGVSSNSNNYIIPKLIAAINPLTNGKANDSFAKSVVDYLINQSLLEITATKVPRQGRGGYIRKCYGVTTIGMKQISTHSP